MENQNFHEGYISYNGLNRPPLFFGVPIMVFVGLITTSFFVGFPLIAFVSTTVGFFFLGVLGVIYFAIKILCEDDPNAIGVVKLKIKGFFMYKFKKVLAVRG